MRISDWSSDVCSSDLSQSFRVRSPRPATLFGSGQAQMIADLVQPNEAELVIIDNSLSPIQQSNLEKATEAKVIDRTGLILDIFGERAATARSEEHTLHSRP